MDGWLDGAVGADATGGADPAFDAELGAGLPFVEHATNRTANRSAPIDRNATRTAMGLSRAR
jgi:hypothetical protein